MVSYFKSCETSYVKTPKAYKSVYKTVTWRFWSHESQNQIVRELLKLSRVKKDELVITLEKDDNICTLESVLYF